MKEVFKRWKILSTLFFIVFLATFVRVSNDYNDSFYIAILLFFIYYGVTLAFLYRLEFLMVLQKLADKLGFETDLHLIFTPKLEGTYKRWRFKIEYWYKSTGKSPLLVRTYVKQYFNRKLEFDSEKVKKFKRMKRYAIALKYNEQKNYLILKVKGNVTDFNEIMELFQFLIDVSHKARKTKEDPKKDSKVDV